MLQQTSNGGIVPASPQQNGTISDSGGLQSNGNIITEPDEDVSETNTEDTENIGPPKVIMDQTNQDIIRLIGQHLRAVGLE